MSAAAPQPERLDERVKPPPPVPRVRRSRPRRVRPRTAFVLSGGASLGAMQVGMLQALYEREIAPDLLVGTSVGALNAAFVASRPQTAGTAEELAEIWLDLQRGDVFPVRPWRLLGGLLGRRDHLVPGEALRALVRRHVEFDDVAGAAIPLHLVAYDVVERGEVLLSEGPAIEAVAGSAALPGVLPPVDLGGRRLIDGGVVNNTPISHAVELGAKRIYVLPTADSSRDATPWAAGALGAAIAGVQLLVGRRLEHDIARYSALAELVILPAPNPLDVQPTDFGHASRLIEDAREAAHGRLSAPTSLGELRQARSAG
jgi:NTE family protein